MVHRMNGRLFVKVNNTHYKFLDVITSQGMDNVMCR